MRNGGRRGLRVKALTVKKSALLFPRLRLHKAAREKGVIVEDGESKMGPVARGFFFFFFVCRMDR